MRLSGLEPFTLTPDIPFVNIGERTNVTGSAKFRKLITAGDFAGALAVAREQVANGAQIVDVNMDEGLIDSEAAMIEFLNLVASEPDIARVPVMVDSSKFSIIEAGLKRLQGKSLVNSISMKEGEEAFLRQANLVRRYGAAVVVMAFDEQGQADTFERKVAICARAYKLLTEKIGFPPEDIVFDPNVFAIATGIDEHNNYGVDFIEAARKIRLTLPHAHISGGVSNLSFSFRGNEPVREAMHAVFLYHAIQAGMDMGIVNAGQLAVYDEIDPELREACEDVVLNRRHGRNRAPADHRRALPRHSRKGSQGAGSRLARGAGREAHRPRAGQRHHGLHRGRHRGGAPSGQTPARRHRGPADGGNERRRRPVRRGKDVPAAGGEVGPRDEAGRGDPSALHGGGKGGRRRRQTAGTIVLATVKGDVHDIGKNIVGVVLACNNYEIIDLGVMTPASKILAVARERKADAIGLSGLITPSLDEMVHVAAEMEREGFDIPLLIGGATTSRVHTAVKIHPRYARSQAVHVNDASRAVGVVSSLLSPETRASTIAAIRAEYRKVAAAHERSEAEKTRVPLARARANAFAVDWSAYQPTRPSFLGTRVFGSYDLEDLARHIDWTPFFQTWEMKGRYPAILDDPEQGAAARTLFDDAQAMLKRIITEKWLHPKAVVGFWPAAREGDDIALFADDDATDPSGDALHLAPATRKARRPAQSGARRFRRAEATISAASW